jgi:hypothetical protein
LKWDVTFIIEEPFKTIYPIYANLTCKSEPMSCQPGYRITWRAFQDKIAASPSQRVWFSRAGAQEFAFLTSSQLMLLLAVADVLRDKP